MPVKPPRRRQKRPALRLLRGNQDRQAQRLVQTHLPLLRTYRDVESFCAFVWPEEVRQVHSVIDRTYGAEPEERRVHAQRVQGLEERHRILEALLWAEEGA